MATGESYFGRSNYRFFPGDRDHQQHNVSSDAVFEFNESDIFNSGLSNSPEFRRPTQSRRHSKKPSMKRSDSSDRIGGNPASLPVNIPDWSKILRDAYSDDRRRDISDDDVDDGGNGEGEGEGGGRIPPHEFLAGQMARTRIASFSVHEGIGRTLKGRDLSRVRNSIWEKTGFQD